jgi:hypothetical protein
MRRRFGSSAAITAAVLGAFVGYPTPRSMLAQTSQQSSQQAPTFRTRIDLRQLDVTVLDRNRRPVRGLTAEDFVLVEDGVTQTLNALEQLAPQARGRGSERGRTRDRLTRTLRAQSMRVAAHRGGVAPVRPSGRAVTGLE